jgi:transglutaminase-like putative cysteine protease
MCRLCPQADGLRNNSRTITLGRMNEMHNYLAKSDFIDCDHPAIVARAAELASSSGQVQTAKRCFEFVRDHIQHSMDFRRNPVTCKASDVLHHGTGFCYAKSHLLAALLRANGIPAGLCYQRLRVDAQGSRLSLHGLNAVYLKEYGWYRIDARGNKSGVDAQFDPPVEKLAFPTSDPGEVDLPLVHTEPISVVIKTLLECATYDEVYRNLPDIA